MHDGDFDVLGVEESGMISGCENIDACGIRTVSQALVQGQRYGGSSVIRTPELSSIRGENLRIIE